MPLLEQLDRGQAAQVQHLIRLCQTYDDSRCLSDDLFASLCGGGPASGTALLLSGPEGLGAYGQLRREPSRQTIELCVHPGERRRGLGSEIMRRFLALSGPGEIWLWSFGDRPASSSFAQRHGFARARNLHQVGGPLLSTGPLLPALRCFRPGHDESAWLALHRSLQSDPRNAISREELERRLASPWHENELFLLWEENGQMLAYLWLKPVGDAGECYMFAVAPQARRRGLARGLAQEASRRLAERGLRRLIAFIDGANAPGMSLYQSLGLSIETTDTCWRRG